MTPKVREIKVKGISAKAPKRHGPPGRVPGRHRPQAQARPKRLVALSDPERVSGYATVGVTWKHGTDMPTTRSR